MTLKQIDKSLHELIKKTAPQLRIEKKWGEDAYIGNDLLFSVWVHKKHISFVFYNGARIKDEKKVFNNGLTNLNSRRIRFEEGDKIPEKDTIYLIKEAIKLDEAGWTPKANKSKSKLVKVPKYIADILDKNGLRKKFDELTFFKRKGYVQWIEEAKQEETKEKRIKQMLSELPKRVYMGNPA